MPARKLPPDSQLIEMYQSGLSAAEVAERLGVVKGTVATKLNQLGVTRTNSETWNLPGRHAPLAEREWFYQKYVSFQVKELRTVLSNLVLLCHDCHMWVHSSENVNKEFIKEPKVEALG